MGTNRRILGSAAATALVAGAVLAPLAVAQGTIAEEAKSHEFDWGTFTLAPRIIDKVDAGEPLNIVVNNQGTGIAVFGAEQAAGTARGCEKNKDRLNIQCRLTGPPSTDQTAQLAELETMLAADQVDCLGSQSVGPDAYVDVLNKYVDAGIPVFTQNTDVPSSKRFAFFALNERDAGRANGEVTAQLVTDMGAEVKDIAMGSGGPEQPWAQDRMGGFIEGYTSVFPDASFLQDEKSGLDLSPSDSYAAQEAQDQAGPYMLGNPDANLFFATDQTVLGPAQAIRDAGRTDQAWSSGFNVNLPLLDLIDQGIILTTINQGFDTQAELAVTACVDYLTEGKLPPDPLAYLDPIIITKDGGEGRQTTAEARDLWLAIHQSEVEATPAPAG